MLQATTFKFIKDLKKNNNKQWFENNRKIYESAKADFYSTVDNIIEGIKKFDKPIGALTAKDCAFRINRDVRFSKDKSPYKTNMGASITKVEKRLMVPVIIFIANREKVWLLVAFICRKLHNLLKYGKRLITVLMSGKRS